MNYIGFKKITKPTARKLFNADKEIIVIRNKCRLGSMFQANIYKSESYRSKEDILDPFLFDKLVTSYEYYHSDSELGNYTHYYTKGSN